MTKVKAARVAAAVLTLALAAALAAGALDIYREGMAARAAGDAAAPIYTADRVRARMSGVAIVAATWLAAVIAATALSAGQPQAVNRTPTRVERAKAPFSGRGVALARAALLIAAAVFIALGALNGGLNDVLVKAINICTECIGLG